MVEEVLYSTRHRSARVVVPVRGRSRGVALTETRSPRSIATPARPLPARREPLDDPWADDPDRYVDDYKNDESGRSPGRQSARSTASRSATARSAQPANPVQRLVNPRWRKGPAGLVTRRWIPWIAGGSLLLLSDWKLGSAAAAGGAVVWLVYRTEPRHWQALDRQIQDWLRELNRGANGKLAIAVAGGGTAMLATYVAAAVLGESTGWLGAATVLQGLGTLGALALLVRHWLGQPTIEHDRLFHRAIDRLSDRDPLAQVAATRQLGHLADRGHLDRQQQRTAADCVRLLLQQGCDRPVREAAWDTLAMLEPVGAEAGPSRATQTHQASRSIPVNLPRSARSNQGF